MQEFDVLGCRVCLDINQWKERARKSAFSRGKSDDSNQNSLNVDPKIDVFIKELDKVDTSDRANDYLSECPLDKESLGRATWSFLHTMAAYYPRKPSDEQIKIMDSFIHGLAAFYPCQHCAEHLREQIYHNPPKTKGQEELSTWFCQMHNLVNARLGKEQFDCSQVMLRWRGEVNDESNQDEC